MNRPLGSGLYVNWGPAVLAFWKSAKRSVLHGRHVAGGEESSPDPEASAAALQLRDVDPVHSFTSAPFTSTEELRRKDSKYVQLWPSDIPHKRR
ncbi:hypothetical protein [Pseudarthrobacter sp. DSP2-3-2b1]|uniref:hypothetical protein n=1 Tax=Pseudarthrobacter sp. DSP2-3-2b1 TaxID=2804661 RepID=UPI003CF8D45D